ncbi:hypothetical protein ACOBQX_01935 [Actinokineospora sp. G85]|uniref:hypothetical protein n=1 Tax=Actinokineospora sp. G85 TaxID=3406626 RepID=UPI003C75FBDC
MSTTRSLTPSSQLSTTPHVRIYHRGHTFRLAKGDTLIAVFRGTTIEQHRYLIIHDHLPPGPITEGPQTPTAAIPTPPGHHWADTKALHIIAHRWLTNRP